MRKQNEGIIFNTIIGYTVILVEYTDVYREIVHMLTEREREREREREEREWTERDRERV